MELSHLNQMELSYGSLKRVSRFSTFVYKNAAVGKIMGPPELIYIFFQKLSRCTTTLPRFLLLAYP